jgi:hypothetical protein
MALRGPSRDSGSADIFRTLYLEMGAQSYNTGRMANQLDDGISSTGALQQ